jgi:hypothetical protein
MAQFVNAMFIQMNAMLGPHYVIKGQLTTTERVSHFNRVGMTPIVLVRIPFFDNAIIFLRGVKWHGYYSV